jgi:hypothetical protein
VRDPSLDASPALRPTMVIEPVQARAFGRKTTARRLAHWLLTGSEGVQHSRRSTEEVGIE